MHDSNTRVRVLAFSLASIGILLSGCGGDGITRHEVSGSVTYQGKEVTDGVIVFEPDISVGAVAPTCFVTIANGKYKTLPTESPTTGKYKVRVNGYDKSKMKKDAAPGEIIDMPELFPPFDLEVKIPPPNGRFDITVPDSSSPSPSPSPPAEEKK